MSGPSESSGRLSAPRDGEPLSLLLVEDDRADAIIVEELIADAGIDTEVIWASSMGEAEQQIVCV